MSLRSKIGTLAIVAIYAAIMICTNTHFSILDDESSIIAVAGHPVLPTLELFVSGNGQHEHPPVSDILLHLWLVSTGFSFFFLRVFANIFYIAAIFFTALSANKIGGSKAYWVTLVLGLVWPFAFQYGRITGWYCFSMFLVSLLTWEYLRILDDQGRWPWGGFGITSVLLVWTNYFGIVILLLLLVDFLVLHRNLASKHVRLLLTVLSAVLASFLPLLRIVFLNIQQHEVLKASNVDWKGAIASVGYPVFAIFGSAAVAPWYLPLSAPICISMVVLIVSICFSSGCKWLVYFVLAMILLVLTAHMDIKRVLFLIPWLFLAMGITTLSSTARYPKLAASAIAVIVITGWLGITLRTHYATTNLYEPWGQVAQTVAEDARRGATIVSPSPSFFFYLNYQLGLEAKTNTATWAYLGEDMYRSSGYKILSPNDPQARPDSLRGKVVLVRGTGDMNNVRLEDALNDALHNRCFALGEYRAAPDPAVSFKRRFARNAPLLIYRTDVIWYNCPDAGK